MEVLYRYKNTCLPTTAKGNLVLYQLGRTRKKILYIGVISEFLRLHGMRSNFLWALILASLVKFFYKTLLLSKGAIGMKRLARL